MSETKDTPATSSVNPRMGSAARDVLHLLQEDLQRRAAMDVSLSGLAGKLRASVDLLEAQPKDDLQPAAALLKSALADAERLAAAERGETRN